MKKYSSFSLIELLVVMTIMGIIATLGLMAFSQGQKKARDATRKENLSSVRKALEMYYNDKGAYPVTGLLVWGSPFVVGTTTYMAKLPTDPGGGNYVYKTMNVDKDFAIFARLDNTQDAAVPLHLSLPGAYTTVGTNCNGAKKCNYVIHTKGYDSLSTGPDS